MLRHGITSTHKFRYGLKSIELKTAIIITFSLIVLIVVSALFLPQLVYSQGNTWYVGKGLEPNKYYTYQIREFDTNQGRPFFMTIYFKEFDSANNVWIAPVFVVDQGRVFNGTFHLSGLDLSALGSSQLPPEMQEYRNAYANSLQWLAAFVPKPGQSLSAPNWGKIAAIGGQPVAPLGAAQITTPAGTLNTIAVGWHYGEDNRIWINPNMPYPVKAETFAAVTTGNPPIQYAYELEATGEGQPSIPESQFEAPEPPLSQPGITYGFTVTSSNGTTLVDLNNQKASEGTSTQTVTFLEPGRYTIEVNVESVTGQPLGMFVESARFTVLAE